MSLRWDRSRPISYVTTNPRHGLRRRRRIGVWRWLRCQCPRISLDGFFRGGGWR